MDWPWKSKHVWYDHINNKCYLFEGQLTNDKFSFFTMTYILSWYDHFNHCWCDNFISKYICQLCQLSLGEEVANMAIIIWYDNVDMMTLVLLMVPSAKFYILNCHITSFIPIDIMTKWKDIKSPVYGWYDPNFNFQRTRKRSLRRAIDLLQQVKRTKSQWWSGSFSWFCTMIM